MSTNSTLVAIFFLLVTTCSHTQEHDSLKVDPGKTTLHQPNYFQTISGGLSAFYKDNQARSGIDMSIQTCHYFLVMGKRYKNDSVHAANAKNGMPLTRLYRGLHFYVLNRAALHFDSIRSMATNYLTSLQPSPLTLRIQKEFFLTQQKAISSSNLTPVISVQLIGDGRAIPYLHHNTKMKVGASGHVYLSLSTLFKRIEYDLSGKRIDQGVVYLRPSIGVGYGSDALMKQILRSSKNTPILSTECRLGFQSDKHSIKDFSFSLGYAITEILEPRIQMGVLLTAIR